MIGTILIVSRNNLHLTKNAVSSSLLQDIPCDVLVIDNASSDGTLEWLRSKPRIAFSSIAPQQSLSYCWNLGLENIWCNSYAPVLVINNDVELRKDTYRLLREYSDKESKEFVTGVSVRSAKDMERQPLVGVVSSPHPDFSCFLITKSCYRDVGKFDEEFFPAFYEDNDYHVRMHRAGIEAVSLNIPFLHHGSQTVANANSEEAIRIKRGAEKNKKRFELIYECVPGTPEYDALFTSLPVLDEP